LSTITANNLDPDPAAPEPGFQPPLGERAARGFAYQVAQIGGIKVINLAGQFILSWILFGQDYGHISEAYVIATFISILGHMGLREMLIRRWQQWDKWVTPAFWMSLTLGTLSTLMMIGVAPLGAWFFQNPQLKNMLLILGLQNVFISLTVVPDAKLNNELRFRAIAAINFVASATLMISSVILALLGFGAYSFVWSWPIMSVVRVSLLWWYARPKIGRNPHIKLWKDMFGDNGLLLAAAFLVTLTAQGDYLILGWMYPQDKSVVGNYFWAFNLSTQTLSILATNVAAVLLPSLSKLQDEPKRLLSAFTRAAQALTILAVPACLVQAAAAEPFIKFAFPPKWYPAIPIVQILSLGWTVFAVRYSSDSLLKAEGRFFRYLAFTGFSAAMFMTFVFVGAKLGMANGAAIGVGVYACLSTPLGIYVATRKLGGNWRNVLKVFTGPLAAGIIATAIGWAAGQVIPKLMPPTRLMYALQTAVIALVCFVTYIPLIRLFVRPAYEDLLARIRAMLGLPVSA
jgi:teichuronic acid exporter